VIDFGGFLGFGSRPIAVPVDAMVLLGQDMEIVAFTPKQLQQFPTFSPSGTTHVPDNTITKVGLAKPSHGEQKSGLIAESTTGAPLIPRSASSLAKAWTVISGSTVITSVVITSIARIVHLPTVRHADIPRIIRLW
jgi:hypothetical protein